MNREGITDLLVDFLGVSRQDADNAAGAIDAQLAREERQYMRTFAATVAAAGGRVEIKRPYLLQDYTISKTETFDGVTFTVEPE